jgi:hypothetical protein
MSQVYLSADYVLPRTAMLMNDLSIDLMRIVVPFPVVFPVPRSGAGMKKTYKMTHAERTSYEESQRAVFEPMALWGPIERPDFVIDEVPY